RAALPTPTIHCAPSVLKRKKFGDGLTSVVAWAPDEPLMNVMFGWVFEYSFTAMPSEPDSGPTMMSTLSCSTSLRVAFTATSGLASDEALTISILRPATTPLRWRTASSAPRIPSWPPAANGPSRVASRPILTGGGWAQGAGAVGAGA